MNSKRYKKIDGIKVDESMPEDQKKTLRDDATADSLDLEELQRTSKQRVTIMLDTAIVNEAKRRAKTGGVKYQSLLNDILKNVLIGHEHESEIESMSKKIDEIHTAIKNLEKAKAS